MPNRALTILELQNQVHLLTQVQLRLAPRYPEPPSTVEAAAKE